ncbi:hypothetical protein LOC68_13170 [Blastopirellula sp. JC732]|uniref:Uncharacterized protein n=1 Tax=Blastopirellula sediminis TaxID=2894196 RepID=A0A9X1MMG7_9BACT|nr:hypothetical protein [Blastopirellula sediminis]MCC9607358.1 hypothetical protein [Blastopirellula sediminis]MCC9629349.1 hypothetical protein [Blastopirellula sediminis]
MKGPRLVATKIAVLLSICALFVCIALENLPRWNERRENSHALSKRVKGGDYFPSQVIQPDDDFHFRFSFGSGWHGYDQLLASGNGNARYVFRDRTSQLPVWKLATLQLSRKEVDQLCEELRQIDFGNLDAEYHADVHDGTQMAASLQCGEKYKHVYCNNYFPSGILRLSKHVHEEILAQHRAEIDAAVSLSFEEMREFQKTADKPSPPSTDMGKRQ